MKDYNGFTGGQRNKAQRWLNQQWSNGSLSRPTRCVACGQTDGVIDAHAEDYSEPFRAGVTDGFHLCFACHMMVHCRHRNQFRWLEYRSIIEEGAMTVPFLRRDWPRFERDFLRSTLHSGLFIRTQPAERFALREIERSQDDFAAGRRPPRALLPQDEVAERPRPKRLAIVRR